MSEIIDLSRIVCMSTLNETKIALVIIEDDITVAFKYYSQLDWLRVLCLMTLQNEITQNSHQFQQTRC